MQAKIGTRGSKLALWQANTVREILTGHGIDASILTIKSEGDLVQAIPLHQIGMAGIFTHALDQALIKKEADIAVHSAKDMPSVLPEELEIVAFLKREDPRDVLLATDEEVHLENFSRQLIIGTSSLRRTAFLKHYFSQVEVRDIRGNVDTRIAKMEAGEYDGIILAYAGVKRMGMERYIVQKFNLSSFTSAIGQGAIAVACRKDYPYKDQLRIALNHSVTECAVRCERAYLRTIDGGCKTPAFAHAQVMGESISITGGIAEEDGSKIYRHDLEGLVRDAQSLGVQLGQHILKAVNEN